MLIFVSYCPKLIFEGLMLEDLEVVVFYKKQKLNQQNDFMTNASATVVYLLLQQVTALCCHIWHNYFCPTYKYKYSADVAQQEKIGPKCLNQ